MADKMPDYKVEMQRLRLQISSLKTNLERYELEILEAESRMKQARINIEATNKAIEETDSTLQSLISAHSEVNEDG